MYGLYCNRTTPFFAFLEGMVRMFDWAALLELRKRRSASQADNENDDWSGRIVDWYIRDSITTFEQEEPQKVAQVPIQHRRAFAAADIVLGPLPVQDVILCYESIVPGACDRIMQRASDKLKRDGQDEIRLLKERAKQGYMGMAVGFLLTMLLACGAMFLIFSGHLVPGFSLAGVFLALIAAASGYVSKARVRRKFYTREFFFKGAQYR